MDILLELGLLLLLLGLLLLPALSDIRVEFGCDGRVLPAISLAILFRRGMAEGSGGVCADLLQGWVDQLILRIKVASHASCGLGVVEMERLQIGVFQLLLSLELLKAMHKVFLQALKVRHRLGLGWHEGEQVLQRLTLRILIQYTSCLALKLLLIFVLLHAGRQL